MTALTPQQMWDLADRRLAAQNDWASSRGWQEDAEAAIRTAADQLEAVRATLDRYAVTDEYNPGMEWTEPEDVWRLFRDLRAILTADTAPQDGNDD